MTLTNCSSDLPGWRLFSLSISPNSGLTSAYEKAVHNLRSCEETSNIMQNSKIKETNFRKHSESWWHFVCIFHLLMRIRMNGFFQPSSIRKSVIFMCWFLILCECVPVACKKHGSRKTVPQSSNQTAVIQRLSNFFGIDRIPGRIFRKPPPDYMMDLYNSITDSGGLMKREGPYKADVIRSFPDRREYHFRWSFFQF
jgi:hypothetical protein